MGDVLANVTTVRRKVGTCPGCHDYLWADVTVAAEVGTPTFHDRDDKPKVYAHAKVIAVSLPEHSCALDDDGIWTQPEHEGAEGKEGSDG